MASVKIKNSKNSRTHDIIPLAFNLVDTYYAEEMDGTHWKVFHGDKRYGYIVWPVEDIEVLPKTRRISSKGANTQQIAKTSDGGSSPYYAILPGEKGAQDIIERKSMNFARGNVFKAAWRMGEKDVASELYDWKKIKWFAEREIARLEKASG